jgi:hypothetical protein
MAFYHQYVPWVRLHQTILALSVINRHDSTVTFYSVTVNDEDLTVKNYVLLKAVASQQLTSAVTTW